MTKDFWETICYTNPYLSIFMNKINVNQTLVDEGHAYSYHGEKEKKYENK